jgi:tRNA threonylcarbamoyladenosine biosynthesis protein TsaB
VSYLLHIDTAVTSASICLSEKDQPLLEKANPHQKDHAAWLHPAIHALMKEAGISLSQLSAIVVSSGPGSYTGLRVGMSAAKGLCYALNKPLILVNTLQMMAAAAQGSADGLLCPMIDARRMEIFTAIYDNKLQQIMQPRNMIVTENSFLSILQENSITFFGNGYPKLKDILAHPNSRFLNIEHSAKHLTGLGFSLFKLQQFADLAYAEPFYGKEFYTPQS